MKLTKIIITLEQDFFSHFKEKFGLNKIGGLDSIEAYSGERKNLSDEEENIILVYGNDTKKIASYIKENYDTFKVVVVGKASTLSGIDIKPSDVILPNTFLSPENKNPIFLEYAVGENYDLKKFGLFLSGVCLTGESKNQDEFEADILDKDSYAILSSLKDVELLDKTVVVKGIIDDNNNDFIENTFNVVDLIL